MVTDLWIPFEMTKWKVIAENSSTKCLKWQNSMLKFFLFLSFFLAPCLSFQVNFCAWMGDLHKNLNEKNNEIEEKNSFRIHFVCKFMSLLTYYTNYFLVFCCCMPFSPEILSSHCKKCIMMLPWLEFWGKPINKKTTIDEL